MSLDELVGMCVNYYGYREDNGDYLVQLGSAVYRVEYDPDDGYRSSCRGCERDAAPPWNFGEPLAYVRVQKANCERRPNQYTRVDEGWTLIDVETEKPVLSFGTDGSDDYYPCFTFLDFTGDLS